MTKRTLLHVGSGTDTAPEWAKDYQETRVDIDPTMRPDIVASMTDLGEIGTYDLLYCAHALEHVYPHQVNKALTEFHRVLNDGGSAVVFVPDLEGVQATEEVLYESPAGPITGLDLIYGLRWYIEQCEYMAHKTGFVKETLADAFNNAGFSRVEVKRMMNHNLMAVGWK